MEQVAVGRVQLDAVESCLYRSAGRRHKFLDDARQFRGGQGARDGERLLARVGAGFAVDRDGAGRDHFVATGGVLVRDAAGVHDLCEDPAPFGVHGGSDVGPALELLGGHEPGLAREAPAGAARVGAFTDDQAERSTLTVVLDDQRPGDAFLTGTETGQRPHHESVGQFQVAEGHRGKQHAQFLSQ